MKGWKDNRFKCGYKCKATISGVSEKGNKYISEKGFDYFKEGLKIPKSKSNLQTATYIDDAFHIKFKDYLGKEQEAEELSAINLSEREYNLSIGSEFANMLMAIYEKRKILESRQDQ